jgi:excisionase family DNA binding protein
MVEADMKAQEEEVLLTPAEVAALFRVDPKTVTRWAKAGKLSSIRTLGGHRRYRADEVKRFLDGARQDGLAARWALFDAFAVARGGIELPTPRFSVPRVVSTSA